MSIKSALFLNKSSSLLTTLPVDVVPENVNGFFRFFIVVMMLAGFDSDVSTDCGTSVNAVGFPLLAYKLPFQLCALLLQFHEKCLPSGETSQCCLGVDLCTGEQTIVAVRCNECSENTIVLHPKNCCGCTVDSFCVGNIYLKFANRAEVQLKLPTQALSLLKILRC